MKITLLLMLALFLIAPKSWASGGDDSLQYFLSKSQAVITGEVELEPNPSIVDKYSTCEYFKVQHIDTLAGEYSKSPDLQVAFRHHGPPLKELPAYVQQGAKCILFLRHPTPANSAWEVADVWFGLRPYDPVMAAAIGRLWWQKQIGRVKMGMTRREVIKILPDFFGFQSNIGAGEKQFTGYYVDSHWYIQITYDVITFPLDTDPDKLGRPRNKIIAKPVLISGEAPAWLMERLKDPEFLERHRTQSE